MGKLGVFLSWLLFAAVAFAGMAFVWTSMHEEAHAAVFRTFGYSSEIKYYSPLAAETFPLNASRNLTECEGVAMTALQAGIDAEQYQQVPMFVGFFVILVVGVLLVFKKREGELDGRRG